jgi:hypothetical protein
MKTCSKCKEEKEIESFSKSSVSKDGFQAYCRTCSKQVHNSWTTANVGDIKLNRKLRYKSKTEGTQVCNHESFSVADYKLWLNKNKADRAEVVKANNPEV